MARLFSVGTWIGRNTKTCPSQT